GYDVRTEVLGSAGALIVGGRTEPAPGGLRLLPPMPADADPTPFFVRRFAAAYTAQIEHFIDCIEQARQPAVGGQQALAAFEIAHAARLAAQTGRSVSLAELHSTVSI
ncbi:MAG: hypothetical protein LC797_09525, partial [Chloroflexi bacterium]|nr:hypothetical protein [Chloroflexota bacterium]